MAREDQDRNNWDGPWSSSTQPPATPPTTPNAPASAGSGPIPTNPDGSQVGSGTPWAPGSDHPAVAPPGYHWDATLASFQPDAPTPNNTGTARPTGGVLTDPSYAAKYVAWAGTQPGVNPSVKNDPNYWISRFTSGAFGNDQDYALQRMLQAEGAPEGGVAAPPQVGGGGSSFSSNYGPSSYAPPPGVSAELYNQLLQRAKQGTAIDPNDPNIRQQVVPYRDQIERERRNYLAQVAEKSGPLANINGESRMSAEKAGQATGLFASQLVGKELQSRRDEIAQALQQLGARLTSDQQLALTQELHTLDSSLQKYGIDTSAGLQQQQINSGNDQFAANFGLNSTNQANYWDSIRNGTIKG